MPHYLGLAPTSWCRGTCPLRTLWRCRRRARWRGWVWQGVCSHLVLFWDAFSSLPQSLQPWASSSRSGLTRQTTRRWASHYGQTRGHRVMRRVSTATRANGGVWSATPASAPRSAPCPRRATGGLASAPARRDILATSVTSALRWQNTKSREIDMFFRHANEKPKTIVKTRWNDAKATLDPLLTERLLKLTRPQMFSRAGTHSHSRSVFRDTSALHSWYTDTNASTQGTHKHLVTCVT